MHRLDGRQGARQRTSQMSAGGWIAAVRGVRFVESILQYVSA